jgi:quercetin dioxygenase-like cupin family protein
MPFSRRDLCALLPLAALSAAVASDSDKSLVSSAFPFSDLPVKTNENATTRAIVNSRTPTGERVEVHETVLAPGHQPHAPHRHSHSEFWLIREGDVEITINGQPHRLGPGSAAFAASNDLHGIRNVGERAASYFVVALGPMNS